MAPCSDASCRVLDDNILRVSSSGCGLHASFHCNRRLLGNIFADGSPSAQTNGLGKYLTPPRIISINENSHFRENTMSLLSHDTFWNAVITLPMTRKMLKLS